MYLSVIYVDTKNKVSYTFIKTTRNKYSAEISTEIKGMSGKF
ncbi:hypothetical protein GCM10017764_19020 [Sphingobacterium griseoflavum]|uniref:Transposase n=1 Tax=Sphingobacterium griseoflavum TaxID=1474952 RepID=A0ABQ3HVM4_9SPHI|nr:hypothetical protein GCM10017764_19020 [Sphingobacterium griseoflavum]